MLLLRIGRKGRSLWDKSNSIETIIELAFSDKDSKPDLALSVYQIPAEQVVRAFVEHAASAGLRPPGSAANVDLAGHPATLKRDLVKAPFALIRDTHCELLFADVGVLRRFLSTVQDEIEARLHEVTKAQVKAFVKKEIEDNSAEWGAFLATTNTWP